MISRDTLSSERGIYQIQYPCDSATGYGNRNPGPDFTPHMEGSRKNVMASCLADQVSSRQIYLARSLATAANMDENKLSWNLYDCDFTELSKRSAEKLIDFLQGASSRDETELRLAG